MTVVRFNDFATLNFHVLRIFLVIYFSHYVPLGRSFSYNLETCETHSKVTWVTIPSIFCRSHILSVILSYRNHTAWSIHGLSFSTKKNVTTTRSWISRASLSSTIFSGTISARISFNPLRFGILVTWQLDSFVQVLLDTTASKHCISTSYDCVYATYSDVRSAFDLLPMESGPEDDLTQGRISIGELSSIIF